VHGIFNAEVKAKDNSLFVDGKGDQDIGRDLPGKAPWKDLKVDVVIESTGRSRTGLAQRSISPPEPSGSSSQPLPKTLILRSASA